MTSDKRIADLIEAARQKRQDGAGLTVKEWCALVGIGYEKGLLISKSKGFPTFEGLIFWDDWTKWRQISVGLASSPRSRSAAVPRLELAGKSDESGRPHD